MNDLDASGGREPLDSAFTVLSDEHRRELCRYVSTTDRSVFSMSELVDQLAVDTSEEHRDRLRLELVHVHLPMMDREGLLEYDRRQGTVRFDDDSFAAFCSRLESVIAHVGCVEAD